MRRYLSVFMKSPGADEVKTRLRPSLSREEVSRLYEAFVRDTLEKWMAFPCEVKVLCYLGDPPPRDLFPPGAGEVACWPQRGLDLGERMKDYFNRSFAEGATKSVVIGSDSPTLPLSRLHEAFSLLDRYGVVIGPSVDGGYYLIGMNQPHPELFDGIPWGRSDVLQKTVSLNRHLEGRWAFLDTWYDVDTPEGLTLLKQDLERMKRERDKGMPKRTAKFLLEGMKR